MDPSLSLAQQATPMAQGLEQNLSNMALSNAPTTSGSSHKATMTRAEIPAAFKVRQTYDNLTGLT